MSLETVSFKDSNAISKLEELVADPKVAKIQIVDARNALFDRTITVTDRPELTIEGLDNGTVIRPAGDFDVFRFKAPLSRCKLRGIQFLDNPENPAHRSASMICFDHSGNHDQINEFTLENICMYYPFNGVYMPYRSWDIRNSVQKLTVQNVNINQYRNVAFSICNCFDTAFNIIFAGQYNNNANHAFAMRNCLDSGNYVYKATMLGSGNPKGNGFHLDNVSHLQGAGWISDSMKNGIATLNEVDDVAIATAEVRASSDSGINAAHKKGTLAIGILIAQNNKQYHIYDQRLGGKVEIQRCLYSENPPV